MIKRAAFIRTQCISEVSLAVTACNKPSESSNTININFPRFSYRPTDKAKRDITVRPLTSHWANSNVTFA